MLRQALIWTLSDFLGHLKSLLTGNYHRPHMITCPFGDNLAKCKGRLLRLMLPALMISSRTTR